MFALLLVVFSAVENDYADILAERVAGVREYVLWDRTRVDILTDEYAIEVDWAPKWAEAIGQALYYSMLTERKPMIILLVKDADKDKVFIYRCQTVCAKYGIRLKSYNIESIIK